MEGDLLLLEANVSSVHNGQEVKVNVYYTIYPPTRLNGYDRPHIQLTAFDSDKNVYTSKQIIFNGCPDMHIIKIVYSDLCGIHVSTNFGNGRIWMKLSDSHADKQSEIIAYENRIAKMRDVLAKFEAYVDTHCPTTMDYILK